MIRLIRTLLDFLHGIPRSHLGIEGYTNNPFLLQTTPSTLNKELKIFLITVSLYGMWLYGMRFHHLVFCCCPLYVRASPTIYSRTDEILHSSTELVNLLVNHAKQEC